MQVCSFFLFNANRVKKFMIELWLGHFVLLLGEILYTIPLSTQDYESIQESCQGNGEEGWSRGNL